MGTSASKPSLEREESQQEPEQDEENNLRFYVFGNYGDFTTTAVMRRYDEPTCEVGTIDFTPAVIKRIELGGAKYKIVMLSLCR